MMVHASLTPRRAPCVEALDLGFDGRTIHNASRARPAGQAAKERLIALYTLVVKTPQLAQWFLLIIHAQVEKRVLLAGVDQ